MRIDVQFDDTEVKRLMRDVEHKHIPQAAATALNDASRKLRTDSTNDLSTEYHIKPKKLIREQFRIVKKANRRRLRVVLSLLTRVNIGRMKTTQTKRGIRAGGKMYDQAFKYESKVFKRRTGNRLPIKNQFIDMFRSAESVISRNARQGAQARFIKRFEHQLRRRLGRHAR